MVVNTTGGARCCSTAGVAPRSSDDHPSCAGLFSSMEAEGPTVRKLSVDYVPLTTTQGRVVTVVEVRSPLEYNTCRGCRKDASEGTHSLKGIFESRY